jgi:hypothetical protein
MWYVAFTTPDPSRVSVEERRSAILERIAELADKFCTRNATRHDPVLREMEQYVRDLERLS